MLIIITKPKDSSPSLQKNVYCDQFNTVQTTFTEEEGTEKMYNVKIEALRIFAFWTLSR